MVEVHELDAACIRVLRSYSKIETRLGSILGALLGIHGFDSARLLEIIRSNETRYKLIDEFLRVKKPEFGPFWKEMRRALKPLDDGRNKVAHWVAVASFGEDTHRLVPLHDVFVGDDVALKTDDLDQVAAACDRASMILLHFGMVVGWEMKNPDAELHRLRDIFLRPDRDQFLEAMFQRIAEAHVPPPEELRQ